MFVHPERAVARHRPSYTRCSHTLCFTRWHSTSRRLMAFAAGNHYDVLGVPQTASSEDIKVAFRRKAKELHPDVNTEMDAEVRFKECSMAYEVLVDPAARSKYDQELQRTKHDSMSNFFQDIDFADDNYIDLDEWRRQRRDSYATPEPAGAGGPSGEPSGVDEMLRDPSQFLDRLNRFASGLSPSTQSSFWGESSSSAAWRQRVDEYMQRSRSSHSRSGRNRNPPVEPGEDREDNLEWHPPGRADDDDDGKDGLEWTPPGVGRGRDKFGFNKSSGWNPPSWKRGT